MGHYYRVNHDYDSANKCFQDALNLYRKIRSDKSIANIYDNIGYLHLAQSDFPEALDYYTRSLGMFLAMEDEERQSIAYNNIGIAYYRLGLYDESLNNFLKALRLREKLNDPLIYSTLNNLGNIYVRLGDNEKALEMYEGSLEHKRKHNKNVQSTLNNIGQIYIDLKDYDRALKYLSEALRINEEKEDIKRIAIGLNNIAVVYEEIGKLDEALYNYQKALEIKENIGDKYGYANTSKNLANIFLIKNNLKQADILLEKSLAVAKDIGAQDVLKDIYELLSSRYLMVDDFKKAYKYKNLSASIRDSIFNAETSDNIARSRTNYTIEKTLQEKEILEKNNQIYMLELEKDKSYRLTLVLLVLLLILIAIFLFYRYSRKKKMSELLALTNTKLEEEVSLRTAEILETNKELRKEIEMRKEAGKKLEESLDEKNEMLQEIHHRVNNNLQIIASILNMQRRTAVEEESLNMFKNTHDRVLSMSLVHGQSYLSENFALLDLNKYVRSLVISIFSSYNISYSRIKPIIEIEDIKINVNTAIPCGLLINEIVTNAIKHGFNKDKENGEINIKIHKDEQDFIYLEIYNNGESIPDGINYEDHDSVGLELIRILCLQLSADVLMENKDGVKYKIKFKKLKN